MTAWHRPNMSPSSSRAGMTTELIVTRADSP